MKRYYYLLFFFLLCLTVAGCKSMFVETYAHFKTNQKNIELDGYSPSSGVFSVGTNTSGEHAISVNSNNAFYVFLVSKKGFKPETFVITPTNYNPARAFGAAVGLLAAGIGALSFMNNEYADIGTTGLLIAGGVIVFVKNVAGGSKPNNYRYEKDFTVPELKEFPKRDSLFPFFYVDTNSLKIPASNITYEYYQSFKKYKSKIISNNKYTGGDLQVSNAKEDNGFESDLNAYLYENGYLDTSTTFFQNEFKYLRMRFDFKSVKIVTVDGISKLVSDVELQIFNFIDKTPKITFSSGCESLWVPGTTYSKSATSNLLATLSLDAIYNFLSDPSSREKMKGLQKVIEKEQHVLENITVDTVLTKQQRMSEVAKAVFTVQTQKGHGSCCVISKDGYALTNYHVVLNDTTKCRILLENKEKAPYTIVRVYPQSDLAIIKINHNFEKTISMRPENIEIGEDVFAIGTPRDIELGQSISKGIISGFRKFDNVKYIQTDVKINPGNSGGALVNANGELVGIVSAKLIGNGAEGLGFAIPIEQAIKLLKLDLK